MNLTATLFLAGCAWVLQLVQLPLFLQTSDAAIFREHRRRNTMLLAIPMLIEMITAIWIAQIAGLVLVAAIWIVTFVWYIPAYSSLQKNPSPAIVRRLVAWHWVRTLCWTARAALLVSLVAARLDIY